jgi:hypothetical protein
MLRYVFLASLALLPVAGKPTESHPVPLPPQCANLITHEPLILYESTGGTIAGPYDLELVVYNDGNVRLSSAVKDGGKVARATVDPGVANGLMLQLQRVHSFDACDQTGQATDVPLTTLTVMHGDTYSASHTHSWWVLDESSAPMEAAVQTFIADVFPEF